jgi:hypothetical protein
MSTPSSTRRSEGFAHFALRLHVARFEELKAAQLNKTVDSPFVFSWW